MDQVIQLIGAILILVAFTLAQLHLLEQTSYPYLISNFVGAVLLGVIAVMEEQWGFVLLEVVWGLVSLWSLVMKAAGRVPAAPH
jgi:hypothetical protein